MAPSTVTDAPALRTLLQSWEKGLRTLSMYLPNNPVHRQTIGALREALSELWEQLPELVLTVSEAGLEWKSEIVLPVADKSESLAWTLFRDGVRWMSFSPGAEEDEIVKFLGIVQRARTLTDEDEDDLRTLLWSADFRFIRYKVAELQEIDGEPLVGTPGAASAPLLNSEDLRALLLGDVQGSQEAGQETAPEGGQEAAQQPSRETAPGVSQEATQEVGQETAQEPGQEGGDAQGPAPRPKGVVDLAEYESTLYFLDEAEIDYLRDEVQREYEQNLNENALSALFDIFEEQPDAEVRAEIISILSELLPHLLNSGDLHSVAYLISETQVVLGRADNLLPEHRRTLAGLTLTFSNAEAVEQLLEAIEVAEIEPSADEAEELFAHLTPAVLSTILKWYGRFSSDEVGRTLQRAVDRMAEEQPAAVGNALGSSERVVVIEALRLVRERALEGVGDQLARLVGHTDVGVRNALVPALNAAPTSQTMRVLVRMIEDTDPDVRTAAVKALAMRRFQGALSALEAAVLGKELRSRDLTERRAFFEAYGIIAGESGVANLKEILHPKAFWRSTDSETRACAAMALRHVISQSARGALQKATKDKDLVVRAAAMRALRK